SGSVGSSAGSRTMSTHWPSMRNPPKLLIGPMPLAVVVSPSHMSSPGCSRLCHVSVTSSPDALRVYHQLPAGMPSVSSSVGASVTDGVPSADGVGMAPVVPTGALPAGPSVDAAVHGGTAWAPHTP